MTTQWSPTAERKPEPGTLCETISPGGMESTLRYDRSGLWFFPDGSMYVYYTPQFWRAV